MALQQLFTSRKPYTATTFVGGLGKMFYDETSGALRIGDGSTPGGKLIAYPIASTSTIGGVKLGPGVLLNSEGQLLIDSTGLEFSFGDFQGTIGTYPSNYFEAVRQSKDYSVLSSIKSNEDIIVASNGTGAVRVVGDFSVRQADGSLAGALSAEPIFRVKGDGQIRMLVPGADTSTGAINVIGGLDGVYQAPLNTGVMLHITGIASSPDPTPSRIYNDAQNSFGAFVTRRYNGTAAAPTAVLDGEEILRLSGTAHNGSIIPAANANQRIVYRALGNQTLTNQGGTMEFWATPLNTTTLAKVASIDNVAGITSTKFTGPLTGNVTGTATTATYAQSFNTGTLVTNSVNAQVATTATSAATAYSTIAVHTAGVGLSGSTFNGSTAVTWTLNTATLMANAVTAVQAGKLTAATTINGVSFDGSTAINVANTQTLTIGTGLTGSNYNGGSASTVSLNTATLMAYSVLADTATTSTNAGYAYSFNTGTLVANAVNAVNATTATNAGYAYSFNTGTLVTTSVTAGKVSNALTAGFGVKMSSGSTYDGSTALTLNQYHAVTGPVTVVGNAYALDFSTANGLIILDNSQANFTITISNPVVGKVVRVMSLNMKGGAGATTVTVSGLTAANSSNGLASFQGNANGAVAIVEFICTTTATSGIYMVCPGAK